MQCGHVTKIGSFQRSQLWCLFLMSQRGLIEGCRVLWMSTAGVTCGQTPQLQLKVHICQVGSSKYHSPECNLEAISAPPL